MLASVLVQGSLLMTVARWLKVDNPLASRPAFSLEIEHRGQVHGETREMEILPNMAVVGDASNPMVLAQAHVARALNPDIDIIVRSHSEMEASVLEQEAAGTVFLDERELADSMTHYVLTHFRKPNADGGK